MIAMLYNCYLLILQMDAYKLPFVTHPADFNKKKITNQYLRKKSTNNKRREIRNR